MGACIWKENCGKAIEQVVGYWAMQVEDDLGDMSTNAAWIMMGQYAGFYCPGGVKNSGIGWVSLL